MQFEEIVETEDNAHTVYHMVIKTHFCDENEYSKLCYYDIKRCFHKKKVVSIL